MHGIAGRQDPPHEAGNAHCELDSAQRTERARQCRVLPVPKSSMSCRMDLTGREKSTTRNHRAVVRRDQSRPNDACERRSPRRDADEGPSSSEAVQLMRGRLIHITLMRRDGRLRLEKRTRGPVRVERGCCYRTMVKGEEFMAPKKALKY